MALKGNSLDKIGCSYRSKTRRSLVSERASTSDYRCFIMSNSLESFFPNPPAPNISVVVPCYNAAPWLEQLFASVMAQDIDDWELVLVDDGSKDNTAEIIRELTKRDCRVRGLFGPNGGVARAYNKGGRAAHPASEYLFFLDADDRLKPSALRRMRTYLEHHPKVGLVGCQFDEIDADGNFTEHGNRSRWAPGRFGPRALKSHEYATPFVTFFCLTGQGAFALYRRELWDETGGFPEGFAYAEDTDMFCRMALLADVHYIPARLYDKRVHPSQSMDASNHAKIQAGYLKFRARWDEYEPKNDRERVLLAHARRYYVRQHRPCRDIKVGVKLVGEFVRGTNRDWSEAKRGVKLFVSAARGFVGLPVTGSGFETRNRRRNGIVGRRKNRRLQLRLKAPVLSSTNCCKDAFEAFNSHRFTQGR
jgi:GT2 family glycosyltransferase